MKKLMIMMALLAGFACVANAQELPYAKFLDYTNVDFRQAKFKYHEDYNSWVLKKNHGLQATANVLSAISGATADIRPDSRDYAITVQLGKKDEVAYIEVLFYDDKVYHQLMTFIKDNGRRNIETNSGNRIINKCVYDKYDLELHMRSVGVSATTARTNTAVVKNVDESYNVYHFIINTGVEPESLMITKENLKKAKAKAKGRKDKDVSDLM